MKNPGARAMIIGALLSIPTIALILSPADNNVRRRVLPFAIAGVISLLIGIGQYLSYALRSKEGKTAYRNKWAARGLYHSLVITAVSSGALTNRDLEYIKAAYNETTGLTLADNKIRKIAKKVTYNPGVFFKDIKLYADRIKTPAKKHIIRSCVALVLENDDMEYMADTLINITTSLGLEAEFLALEIEQLLKRDRLGFSNKYAPQIDAPA